MANLITNLNVKFISLVRAGANQRSVIAKDDKGVITVEVPIIKTDDEKRMVYGIVYAANDVDSQNDHTTAEEVEKASQRFMKLQRTTQIDKGHDEQAIEAYVAENWIVRKGDPMFPEPENELAWAVGIKVEDDATWDEVKKGDIGGISLGGTAVRTRDVEPVGKADNAWGKIKKMFGGEKTTLGKDLESHMAEREAMENFWELHWAFQSMLRDIFNDDEITDKMAAVKELKADYDKLFVKHMKAVVAADSSDETETKDDDMSKENTNLSKEDIAALLDKEVPGIVSKAVEAELAKVTEVNKSLDDKLAEITTVTEKLEKLLDTPMPSGQVDTEKSDDGKPDGNKGVFAAALDR